MKIIANERLKVGGEYKPAGKPCDVPNEVGKDLIERGKAKHAQGRPTGDGGGGNKQPSANDLIAEIRETENVERLEELTEDSRKTVADAARARLDDLSDDDPDAPDEGPDEDPDDDGDQE